MRGRVGVVRIPAGVRDGQTIRLAGEGGHGAGGGPPGDLLLRVRLWPHRRFRPRGDDLEVDLAVARGRRRSARRPTSRRSTAT